MKPAETHVVPPRNQGGLFNAHTELRRLLLGKVMPPFTPIHEFERMRRARFNNVFNEDLSDACRLSASDSAAGTSATVPAASTQE